MTLTLNYDHYCQLRPWLSITTLTINYDHDCQLRPWTPISDSNCNTMILTNNYDFSQFSHLVCRSSDFLVSFLQLLCWLLLPVSLHTGKSSTTLAASSSSRHDWRYFDYWAYLKRLHWTLQAHYFRVDQQAPTWIQSKVTAVYHISFFIQSCLLSHCSKNRPRLTYTEEHMLSRKHSLH